MTGVVPLIVLAFALANGEMRETMERMIMVRTSGSDLQPAATGYIYKSDGQGPANVIKLEESEVIKHLEAMPAIYEQPEAFAAPIPAAAGPFYANKDEGIARAAYTIPVVEVSGDEVGASEEIYARLGNNAGYHEDFEKDLGGHSGGFADALGSYHHGESGAGADYGSDHRSDNGGKASRGYASRHEYVSGDAANYGQDDEDESGAQGGGDQKFRYDEASAYGREYTSGKGYNTGDHGDSHGHIKGEKATGFQSVYDKDEFEKDNDFYDVADLGGKFHEHGSVDVHGGSSAGHFHKGGSHDSGYGRGRFGEQGFSSEGRDDGYSGGYSGHEADDGFHHHHIDYADEAARSGGEHFGFEHDH